MDRISAAHRSWNMSRIRSKDTTPEKAVRSFLHRLGFRFRLHSRALPGSPDISLPAHRVAIFVHGCYWHRHKGCKAATTPKTRKAFWAAKFEANVARDRRARAQLRARGWSTLTIWECQTKTGAQLAKALTRVTALVGV